uniref:C2H2-type domain-containing protein n=1 Tax=Leptobrachium leishanense TaxID=445787 RepID=A0A8C5QSR8_9ANUR
MNEGSRLPMECYYILISSSHLNKGHYRNIKGVFRGPLTDSKTLELAEKENASSNALEFLKANFYCELCDKQYHKHQEFDNHINSYDHAHKQRLKELKQREFARNVASKLRKNERKQKKHHDRLHKLADHRREVSCAPGSGPMFKSTTVTIRDHICESLHCSSSAISRSVEKEEAKRSPLESTSVMSVLLSSSESSKNNKQIIDNQIKKSKRNKVSFSFSFPKKTPLKLESSAAVFYEFNDDKISDCKSTDQSSSGTESLIFQSSVPEDLNHCLEKDIQTTLVSEKDTLGKEHVSLLEEQVSTKEFSKCLDSDVCHLKVPSDFGSSANLETHIHSTQLLSTNNSEGVEISVLNPQLEIVGIKSTNEEIGLDISYLNGSKKSVNKSESSPTYEEDLAKRAICLDTSIDCFKKVENTIRNKVAGSTISEEDLIKNMSDSIPSSSSEPTASVSLTSATHKNVSEAFQPVVSRDGTTVLQWPTELLLYTCTQPSISYSCNPLYFDFKASRTTSCGKQPENVKFGEVRVSIKQSDTNNAKGSNDEEIKARSDRSINESESSRMTINKTCNLLKSQDKLKCCGFVRNIKENQNPISKISFHNDAKQSLGHDLIKPKCNKTYLKCKRTKHRIKHISVARMDKFTHRKQYKIYCSTTNLKKQALNSRDSLCSIKYLTKPYHRPYAELGHVEREFLRIPTVQIKQECGIWNVHHKTKLHKHSENKPCKDIQSFDYQTELLALNNDSEGINHSKVSCRQRIGNINVNSQKDETCSFKRTHSTVIDEINIFCKRPRLCKQLPYSVPNVLLQKQKLSMLCGHLSIIAREVRSEKANRAPSCTSLNSETVVDAGNLSHDHSQLQYMSYRTTLFLQKIEKIKKMVDNKIDQLCKSFFDYKERKQIELFSHGNNPGPGMTVRNQVTSINHRDVLPEGKIIEQNKQRDSGIPSLPCSNRKSDPCIMKSHLSDKLAAEKYNESRRNCIKCNTEALSRQPTPCREERMNDQTFIAEELLSRVGLPNQDVFSAQTFLKRNEYHQCDVYKPAIHPNIIPSKLRLIFPTITVQSCTSFYPVHLEQPFCSASLATVQHTLLQHHAADTFTATSVDSVKLVDPPQHFVSPQGHVFPRNPFYQLTVDPTICPGDPFISSTPVPILPNSMVCHIPVPLSHISHANYLPILQTPFIPVHPLI